MWSRGLANLSRSAVAAGRHHHHHLTATATAPPAAVAKNIRPLSTTSSSTNNNPLLAFRDPVDRQTRGSGPVGRSWTVKELRRKSYEDLHKLWYVLYKERNMLLTEQQLSRRRTLIFPQPERIKKVQKSMGAIKTVLGERKRVKIAEHDQSRIEKEMSAALDDDEEEFEIDDATEIDDDTKKS